MVITKKLVGASLIVATFLLSMSLVGVSSADTVTEYENEKVKICHRDNNVYKPYGPNAIEVSINAVDGEGKSDHYGEHKGPLASTLEIAMQLKDNKTKWGDIIPPVEGKHNGLNWTAQGQAIYNNDCNFVDYFMFEKDWKGDQVNLNGVKVTFTFKFNGQDASWNLGDAAVVVKPGDELTNIKETVTGLPENCTYEDELVNEFTIPSPIKKDEVSRKKAYSTGITHTVTATNSVDCEDEDTPQVLGATTSTPQVTAAPVGGVSAGAGGGAASNSVALFGLLGSFGALGLGLIRKWTV